MRLANFLYIVAGNLLEKKWRTLLTVFVIAFSVLVTLGVTAISTGLMTGLKQRAADMFPPTVIMVKPKTVALAMLSFNTASINDGTVKQISELRGVSKVEPQLSLRVPLRMEVEIAGQYAVTDAVVIGVDPDTLQGSVKTGFNFAYDEATSQPIPCIVPRLLLDMYNLAYADSIGLPKINEQFLLGKRFTMVLGGTYLAGGSGAQETKLLCQVVGIVSDPSLVPGVYMPMEYARRINSDYSGSSAQPYTALRVVVDQPDQVKAIMDELSGMGLLVEGNQWAYESITSGIRISTILLYLFAGIIILISAVAILNLFSLVMAHRTGEIRLLMAVGATRSYLRWIYFSEALAMALTGAILGGLAALLLFNWAENLILGRLEASELGDLSIVPEQIFAFDFLPVFGVILCITLVSVAAPLVITWKTTGRVSSEPGAV